MRHLQVNAKSHLNGPNSYFTVSTINILIITLVWIKGKIIYWLCRIMARLILGNAQWVGKEKKKIILTWESALRISSKNLMSYEKFWLYDSSRYLNCLNSLLNLCFKVFTAIGIEDELNPKSISEQLCLQPQWADSSSGCLSVNRKKCK